jgi:thiol-disulfide isomerase/thioredoxin
MTTTLPRVPGTTHVFAGARGFAWALLTVVASLAATCHAGDSWLTSYDEALAAAERSGRPILTIFTGSDWCPHCRTLEDKVLHTETFSRWAQDRVVLLMIDLPQQGISQEERQVRSRVCIKYGVRTFPSALLIGPDGAKITVQSGYKGQPADAWVAAMESHLPTVAEAGKSETGEDEVLSSLDEAVETARDAKRPILLMVSRRGDAEATNRMASLIKDPEFDSLTKDHFVVAKVPQEADAASPEAGGLDDLLGGTPVASADVELIVTDDGKTPLYTQSGTQPPHRVVHGLRRFLAARQTARR